MPYNVISCATDKGNTGKQFCVEDFGQVQLLLIGPKDSEIATQALAETEATWIALFNAAKAARFYPLFVHFNGEFNSEGRITQEGWAGKKRTVRSGTKSATYTFDDISFYNHKELIKHNGSENLGFYEVTANGYIRGWSDDGVVFKPIPLTDFFVNDRTDHTGNEIDASSVSIEYEGSYWNKLGSWVKPTSFDPLLFHGIWDVRLAGTLGVTGMTLTVTYAAGLTGPAGLVAANFKLVNDSAPTVAIPVVVATDNLDGTYVLTWADQTGNGASTFTLFGQPIGTSFFEAINSLTATL